MERTSTFKKDFLRKKLLFSFMFLGLLASQFAIAHDVTGYTTSCATGPVYKVDATVANVNTGSNYAWQYKNSSGNWVCIVNGNNTINGNNYSVSGATSTATTNPAPIVFNNPNSALQGLVIRCVISDGNGVNPCNMPSGNTYNSGSNSVNQTLSVNNTPCAPAGVLQLGNRVWYDVNNNGINTNEDGIKGATVHLYRDDNNDNSADGAFIATDITDDDGYYSFGNLTAGRYIVGVVTPTGYMSSSVNGGDPDNNINFDDNGQVTVGNETRGLGITLAIGTEPDGNANNTNNNITYDFGFLPDCSCTTSSSNMLVNGSFENGTTGWSVGNSTFTTGTGYVACGTKNGFNDASGNGTAYVYQEFTTTPGVAYTFKGFAGTHTAGLSCSPKLLMTFRNAAGNNIASYEVAVTRDVDANHSQLEQYTVTGTAPTGAVTMRVHGAINCNTLKMDAFCLIASCITPATPTAIVTQPTCTVATGTVAINNLPAGSWTINGTADGSPFTFTGSGTTYTQSNVDPGTYVYTVTVSGGCTSAPVTTVVNNQPAPPTAPTATITQPTCSVANGSVLLSGLPSGNWTVTRNPGNTTYTGTGSTVTINTLATGTYSFTVTNASGCVSSATPVIINGQPATPTAPTGVATQPTCTVSTGSIALSGLPSGNWTLTQKRNSTNTTITGNTTTYTVTGLTPATYSYSVTNASGCTSPFSSTIVINAQPASPVAPTATVTQSLCGGATTGNILLSNLPSTGSWTLTRNPGNVTTTGSGTTATVTGLAANTYTFTVTNANGCTSPVTTVILATQTATATLGGTVWIDANKNGLNDDGGAVLSGILVSLYNDANADNSPDGAAIRAFTTTTTGRYSFANLCPGNYIVGFGTLNSYIRTVQLNLFNYDANDSDPDPVTGFTRSINLVANQNDITNDAGYYSTIILPVTFGTISAQARNCEVALSFEILTQKNTKQFEILHSTDGSKWDNISIISARASSAASYKYSFTHTQPAAGLNLYRIKVVDNDGKVSYSPIVSATSVCTGKGQITAYPNPAYEMLNVSLPAAYQDAQVQLFNSMGQLVVSDVRKSGLTRSLNTQNLTPGMYLLKVVHNNMVVMTQKVVKGE